MAFLAFLALNVFKEAYTRHNYNQTAKAQEIILKEVKKKKKRQLITHKGTPIRLSVNFSTKPLQARRQ